MFVLVMFKSKSKRVFILKLKKSFGALVMSAVLLSAISPTASVNESIELYKSVSKSNIEIEKDNKTLDDSF